MQPKLLTAADLFPDQQTGVDTMLEFACDPNQNELLVKGAAGTGKTSMIRVFMDELDEESQSRCVICAPTNKAVKVASELSGGKIETTTIYKFLSLSPQPNGEIKEIQQGENFHERLMATDLVALDEASMSSSVLRPFIQRAIHDYDIKFIYIGDEYQLPPIGEERSWTFDTAMRVELKQVKRHDNAILNLATHIRNVIDSRGQGLKLVEDFNEADGGVEVFRRGKPFDELILDTWDHLNKQPEKDFSASRVLAWRNDKVASYNELVRETLYGRREARGNTLLLDERIVVCNPVQSLEDPQVTLMSTDEEGFIEKLAIMAHPKYPEIECYALQVIRESNGQRCGVYSPTEAGWRVANRMLKDFSTKAKSVDKVYWGAFWTLKGWMNDVRPCHALTTHRSQGSTFRETFVDLDDILLNQNDIEALKSAYVAITRASHKVNVKWARA